MKFWLERQRHLIDFTLASLARRKAKNLGLLAVFTLLVFVLASVMLFSHALRHEAALVLKESPEIILQRLVAGRHDLIPPGYLDTIGRIRGVQNKQGRLWGYYYDSVVKANYTFMVPPDGGIEKGTIVVGPALERERGLAENNGISFRSYNGQLFSYTIAKVLPRPSELVSADLVLMNEADFRAFFTYPEGHYTDIALSVANPLEVRNVASKLANILPDSRPILRDEVLRTYASMFDWREGLMLALLSAALLAFAILAWEKASGLSAEEKREIGKVRPCSMPAWVRTIWLRSARVRNSLRSTPAPMPRAPFCSRADWAWAPTMASWANMPLLSAAFSASTPCASDSADQKACIADS